MIPLTQVKILYIGPYNEGSTSKMRVDFMRQIIPNNNIKVVNIDVPLLGTTRVFRTLGWRFKVGPLISNITKFIEGSLDGDYAYDLVWIDKGVFIIPAIIEKIRKYSKTIVHFTPDPAFTYHRSNFFYKALPFYDYCITTKSFEKVNYESYGVKTILCTQGFDPKIHKPYNNFSEKSGVVFIGHNEEEREACVSKLVESGIKLTVAGNHWEKFCRRNMGRPNLIYKGKALYGEDYAREISGAKMGLGFLSKWIPELHTTRTIEIPACGTALVSERTSETDQIFSPEEVIYFRDPDHLVEQVKRLDEDDQVLEAITRSGYERVTRGGYSYFDIMKDLLHKVYPLQ